MPTINKTFADLVEHQFTELLRLSNAYHREARRCRDAKAYLAGCTMLAAVLEAQLVAMVHCFHEDVSSRSNVLFGNASPKDLLKWDLGQLLSVTKKLGWLPSGLALDEDWSTRKARVGDYAEVLRMIRNLIHPGRYIREHSPARLTAKHLEKSFEILEICTEHLYCKLEDSIRKQLDHRPKRLKGLQRPGKLNRNATKETAKSDRKRRALEQES